MSPDELFVALIAQWGKERNECLKLCRVSQCIFAHHGRAATSRFGNTFGLSVAVKFEYGHMTPRHS